MLDNKQNHNKIQAPIDIGFFFKYQKLMDDIERSIVQRIYMMNPECALFITNKFDQVSREERHSVKEEVERKLLQKWPCIVKQNIVFMSALKEV